MIKTARQLKDGSSSRIVSSECMKRTILLMISAVNKVIKIAR